MTRTIATHTDVPAVHDRLVRRYDQAFAAWSHQVTVADATRDGRDTGPGDEADHASTYAHVGEQTALTQALPHLDELATAVERSEDGSYGRCEGCRRAIPGARLDLFPAATHCVTCKQRLERR